MAMTRHRQVPAGVLARQTVLACGALIAVPLLFYPRMLGLPSLEMSPVVSLFEWGFYLVLFALIKTNLPSSTRVVTAGFTVVCRLALGMILGTLVSWTHMKPWAATTAEMMWSYPLAAVLHIALVPLVLRPVWERVMTDTSTIGVRRRVVGLGPGQRRPVRPVRKTFGSRAATTAGRSTTPMALTGEAISGHTFDDAVSYVGEYQGVRMCWVVDHNGLPLAVWQKPQCAADADFWAPISVEAVDFHRARLSPEGSCRVDRLDIRTDQGRLLLEAVGDCWLGVLTEPETDDLITVRLSRACEMIAGSLRESTVRYQRAGEAEYV